MRRTKPVAKMKLTSLPDEILLVIVSNITVFDVLELRSSCKRLYQGLDPVPTLRWPAYKASTLRRCGPYRSWDYGPAFQTAYYDFASKPRMRLHADDICEESMEITLRRLDFEEIYRCMRYCHAIFSAKQLRSMFDVFMGRARVKKRSMMAAAARVVDFFVFEARAHSTNYLPLPGWALRNGHAELACRLIQDARFNNMLDSDAAIWCLNYSARIPNYLEPFKLLVDRLDPTIRDKVGMQPLHLAAAHGCFGQVKYLLKDARVDPCATSNDGNQAIHHIVKDGRGDGDTLALLLKDPRVDPNAAGMQGMTAFQLAHGKCKQVLIDDPRVIRNPPAARTSARLRK
jgi:hypothetical protein